MIWAALLHLGFNMWAEKDAPIIHEYCTASDTLLCDKSTWDAVTNYGASCGMNMAVIDLGEGVRYDSHPELAAKGAWSKKQVREELSRLRAMGVTPIPKMNFSACHDQWLGEYARMVSSETYHAVCRELIKEVCDLFDKPSYFHLGMDEETAEHQAEYIYQVVRAPELWWHDLYRRFDDVERCGVTPWIWSDFIWHHQESFLAKMPKDVMQTNWYYSYLRPDRMPHEQVYIDAFRTLSDNGYKQIPAGSNWDTTCNFERLVPYCKKVIDPDLLYGFMQTMWKPMVPERKHHHFDALDQLNAARERF